MHSRIFVLALGDSPAEALKTAKGDVEGILVDKNEVEIDSYSICDETWEDWAEFATPKPLDAEGVREQVVGRLIRGRDEMMSLLAIGVKNLRNGADPDAVRMSFLSATRDFILGVFDATTWSKKMISSEETLSRIEENAKAEGRKIYACVFDVHY